MISSRHARLVLPFLALLSQCREATGRNTLQYYFSYDPRSLDPALSSDVPSGQMVSLLFDNLTQFDPDGRLQPGLATRWEPDRQGLVYTFHLRRGVRFHDGRPLVARDVRESFRRALSPLTKGGRAWPLFPIRGARSYAAGADTGVGVAAPDDSTVVVTLESPLNFFPMLLAMPVAAVVPTPTAPDFDQQPVGSGPWTFVAWSHDDQLLLARYAGYWGEAPRSDSLRIRIIPEPLTQAAEYESGRLSVLEVPLGETRLWEANRAAELQRRNSLRILYIALNTTRGPLRDVRVRRALNHAVDVPTILDRLMGGRGTLAAGALAPGLPGYDSSRERYRYDPGLARRLLAEAGYPDGFAVQLWRGQLPGYSRVAQAVQQDLAAVGVKVEIVERDYASARAAAWKGEADLFLTEWYADYPDAENFNFPLFHSSNRGAGANYAFLEDSILDALIVRARSTPDLQEKERLDRTIDARIFDEAPWIFCWFVTDLWAVQPNLQGWTVPAIFTGQRWQSAVHTR